MRMTEIEEREDHIDHMSKRRRGPRRWSWTRIRPPLVVTIILMMTVLFFISGLLMLPAGAGTWIRQLFRWPRGIIKLLFPLFHNPSLALDVQRVIHSKPGRVGAIVFDIIHVVFVCMCEFLLKLIDSWKSWIPLREERSKLLCGVFVHLTVMIIFFNMSHGLYLFVDILKHHPAPRT